MRRSCLTSIFAWIVLETWMYFCGIENESSLGEYSLTLGSKWWRFLKLPDMDQKSFIASPASGSESCGCGRDPSDSPRKSRWLSRGIGRCRIKVDVLRSWSPPWGLIRPSATGKISICFGKCHLFCIESFLIRPSFPTPQCLQPICHPSKFHPRTKRIRGTIQVRLSFHIDEFLIGLSQR